MKTYILVFAVLLFTFSCESNKKSVSIKSKLVYSNGDSIVFYTIDGIKQGKCIEYYKTGNIKSQYYYKNGKYDSLYQGYWENGNLKIVSVFIDGKEDGNRIELLKKGPFICSLTFIEKGIIKISSEFLIARDRKSAITKFYKVLGDTIEYIGRWYAEDSASIIESSSSYYLIDAPYIEDNIILAPVNKELNITFKFFRLFKGSDVKIHFGQLDKRHQLIKKNESYQLDSLGKFTYKKIAQTKGWNYLRGVFEEVNSKGDKREVPIYLNFYVY